MLTIRTTLAASAVAAATLIPLSLNSGAQAAAALAGPHVAADPAAHTAPAPAGGLVSARAALRGWSCDPIADEKFSCQNHAGQPGFTVVLRAIGSLPKWQDDPSISDQIAVVKKTWFLTVQPAWLSAEEFAAVKAAVAHAG
jgi:hypothetical protein